MTERTGKSTLGRSAGPEQRLVHSTSARRSGSAYSRVPHRPPLAMDPNLEMRRRSAVPSPRRGKPLRRVGLTFGVGALVISLVVTLHGVFGKTDSFPVPGESTLTGLSAAQRIVAIAQSQVGYATNPSTSYCNKFSAYWNAGAPGCPGGERSEEWCADFAAWAWQKAGIQVNYGYGPADINGGAVSFYEWGTANGEWHPAASGYVASPGDVAVYGLSLGADPSAVHVAIVTNDASGQSGPDVVNGDGDRTGFSVVETGTDQAIADAGNGDSILSGYVSPPPTPPSPQR